MEPEEKIDLSSLSRINQHHSDHNSHSFLVWKSQLDALLDLKESLHCLHCTKPMVHDYASRHSHYAPGAAVAAALASSRVAHQHNQYQFELQHHQRSSSNNIYHRSSLSPNDDLPLNLICTNKRSSSSKNKNISGEKSAVRCSRKVNEEDDDDHENEDDDEEHETNGRRNSDCAEEEEAPSPVENCEPRNLKKSFMKRYRKC